MFSGLLQLASCVQPRVNNIMNNTVLVNCLYTVIHDILLNHLGWGGVGTSLWHFRSAGDTYSVPSSHRTPSSHSAAGRNSPPSAHSQAIGYRPRYRKRTNPHKRKCSNNPTKHKPTPIPKFPQKPTSKPPINPINPQTSQRNGTFQTLPIKYKSRNFTKPNFF